jgi:hypothetical protein
MKGKCKLCLREGDLRNSHIIPEFLYATTYDELHRAIKVTPEKINKPPYIQKGLREHVLCSSCETQFSNYERYTSGLLAKLLSLELAARQQFVLLSDVDYAPFKLFQMSLLWRSSVTTLAGFQTVSLGSHEEDLRLTLHNEDPGEPPEYSCMLMMSPRGGNVEKMVFTPIREESAGKLFYRLHTGPWFWTFLHPGQFEEEGETDLVVTKSGRFRVAIAQWSEEEFMNNVRVLISRTKLDENKKRGA